MTKFSFALVVMFAFGGSLYACESGKSFQDLIRMTAPCPVGNGEDRGGSLPQSAKVAHYADFFAPCTIADHIAAEKAVLAAENTRIAAENARIKAAIIKAHADARALQEAIASLDAEIAGLNEASAAQSVSSSRSGSRPGSRAGCMSPIARAE